MHGRTCAGTWVTGTGVDGEPREVYLYHLSDNAETMARHRSQAVVWQTAINPVIALELLAAGTWAGTGVLGPEAFDRCPSSTGSRAGESTGTSTNGFPRRPWPEAGRNGAENADKDGMTALETQAEESRRVTAAPAARSEENPAQSFTAGGA